jgi:DNA modification methylase
VEQINLHCGEALDILRTLEDNSVDAVVTDPPAGIEFMQLDFDTFKKNKRSKTWAQQGKDGGPGYGGYGMKLRPAFHTQTHEDRDNFISQMTDIFAETLRVIKPGGWALVWALPRTSHWTTYALEQAGWEIKDVILHTFFNGFPKNRAADLAIDELLGKKKDRPKKGIYKPPNGQDWHLNKPATCGTFSSNIRTLEQSAAASEEALAWEGYGTALKPAVENWILCRKPLSETNLALNILRWGTGCINIDACRAGSRWPNHVVLSHAEDCVFIRTEKINGTKPTKSSKTALGQGSGWNPHKNEPIEHPGHSNADGRETVDVYACVPGCPVRDFEQQRHYCSRFFIVTKPTKSDRDYGLADAPDAIKHRVNPGGIEHDPRWAPVIAKNNHPTVKSTQLMRYFCKLVAPKPDCAILDPFMGSGSTGVAALQEGFKFVGIDRDQDYVTMAERRLKYVYEIVGGFVE